MGFAPTWLRQVSPLLHKTTLTTVDYVFKITVYQRMQNLCKCIIHILTSWNNLTFQQDGAVAMEETHIRAQTKVNS